MVVTVNDNGGYHSSSSNELARRRRRRSLLFPYSGRRRRYLLPRGRVCAVATIAFPPHGTHNTCTKNTHTNTDFATTAGNYSQLNCTENILFVLKTALRAANLTDHTHTSISRLLIQHTHTHIKHHRQISDQRTCSICNSYNNSRLQRKYLTVLNWTRRS